MVSPYKPRVKAPASKSVEAVRNIVEDFGLHVVCRESACPNIAECFERKTATFLILGERCTRSCRFCNVATAKPRPPDPLEPYRLAEAVDILGLSYVVLTSVDRDDLKDFGAAHFVRSIEALKAKIPAIRIEALTPDFKGDFAALDLLIESRPHKLAHNMETVRRLSAALRPQSDYDRSLMVLYRYAKSGIATKTSLMVGLGETKAEIIETMKEIRDAGVRDLTLGQYLRPTPRHAPVARYYAPEIFVELGEIAKEMGFVGVASGPLVRSSYFADRL